MNQPSLPKRRLSLAIGSNLLLELINKVAPLLILHHAQKTLGLSIFGAAQLSLAVIESIQPFITFGFSNYAMATAAEHKNSETHWQSIFTHILSLRLLLAALVSLVFLGYHHQDLSQWPWQEFALLGFMVLSSATETVWYAILRQKLTWINLVGSLLRVLTLVAILLLVAAPKDQWLFVWLCFVPNACISLLSFWQSKQLWQRHLLRKQECLRILWGALPFALIILGYTFFDRLDIFWIEDLLGLESLGTYAGPAKLIYSISLVTSSIALPFMAEIIHIQDPQLVGRHIRLSLWLLSLLVAPILFGCPFIAADALQLVFREMPASSYQLLSILSLGLIGSLFISAFGSQILMARNRPWPMIAGVAVCILGFSLAAPSLARWGQLPALAWGIVAGRCLLGMICLWAARPLFSPIPWMSFLGPMLAGAGMSLLLLLVNSERWWLNLSLGALCYSLCLLIFSWREIRSLLRHPKLAFVRRYIPARLLS